MPVPTVTRSLRVFRLALSYWRDARKIERIKARYRMELATPRIDAVYRAGGERFYREAIDLGGLLIKVGQFLSVRTDVLPLAFTKELQSLQDKVPPAPFNEIKIEIEKSYGRSLDTVFDDFEGTAIAAASLGQVHRATLKTTGDLVAVKVRRPDIERLARIDLRSLGVVMRVIKARTRFGRRINAVQLFEEFKNLVHEELDYAHEQQNLLRFAENFHTASQVVFPRVFPEVSNTRVLVMQYMAGIKISDVEALDDLPTERASLAEQLVESLLKQIIIDGFVQMDPHAGNFLVSESGTLIFLDFGMMAEIPHADIEFVGQLLTALVAKNATGVVASLKALGFLRPQAQPELMVKAIRLLLDQIWGVPLTPGHTLDDAVREFQDFLYTEPLQFPARYMFLGRAIGMLFGLTTRLDPQIKWMEIIKDKAIPMINARSNDARPEWQRIVTTALGQIFGAPGEWIGDQGIRQASRWLISTAALPTMAHRALDTIESQGLTTRPELTALYRKLDQMAGESRNRNNLIATILFTGVGYLVAPHPLISHFSYGIAMVVFLVYLLQQTRLRAQRRRPFER